MKKLSVLFGLLIASVSLISCNKDGSNENFAVSYGEVVGTQESYSIKTDGNNVLTIVENLVPSFQVENGLRVRVNYSIEKTTATGFDVRLNAIEKILTKKPVYSNLLTPEELAALGNNRINVEDAWFGGKYLNVNFLVFRDDLNKAHFINLLVDETASTADNVVVILKHNAYDDPARVPAFGRVSFDISGLVPAGKTSVNITLKWTNYNNVELSDSGVFSLDGSSSSSALTGAKDEQNASAGMGVIK